MCASYPHSRIWPMWRSHIPGRGIVHPFSMGRGGGPTYTRIAQGGSPMCGIAGLFSKSLDVSGSLGGHLGDMLLQLSDRGPDSAGVAFYRDPAPSGCSKVSLFGPPGYDWEPVREALAHEFGAGEPQLRASHAV